MLHNPFGIMQGRLLPPVGDRFQAFPASGWELEFPIAAGLGLDCIEFIFDGDTAAHPLMTTQGLGRIRTLTGDTGVRVFTVCADYFMENTLHKGGGIADNVEMLRRLVGGCAEMEVEHIIIPCVDSSSLQSTENMESFASSLRGCIPEAREAGITFSLETDLSPDAFMRLLAMLPHEGVTVNYDTGNSASLGYDPAEELEAYGGRISDVHIKDRVLGGSTVQLGSGDTDFTSFFEHLRGLSYKGPIVLQAARGQEGREAETVRGQLKFIEPYLEG